MESMHQQSAPGYFFVDHFYQFLNDTVLSRMSEKNVEQTKFDIAAGLQQWTEDTVKSLIGEALSKYNSKNL